MAKTIKFESKAQKPTHLTPEEIDMIRSLNEEFTKLRIRLGDLELEKAGVIRHIDTLTHKFRDNEKSIVEKYGNVQINIETGEIKQQIKDEKTETIS